MLNLFVLVIFILKILILKLLMLILLILRIFVTTYSKSTCIKSANTINYLRIHLKFFKILEIKLFKISLKIRAEFS